MIKVRETSLINIYQTIVEILYVANVKARGMVTTIFME